MRGKAAGGGQSTTRSGITPAYAGKSIVKFSLTKREGDHPRICGEKSSGSSDTISVEGSPPHMRGKDPDAQIQALGRRITPAYAGKRLTFTLVVAGS